MGDDFVLNGPQMPLPANLMVSAGYNRYVIFTCQHKGEKNVKLTSVIRPGTQFTGHLEGDGAVIERVEYINERVGGDKTYYKMVATKLNRWLKLNSEKIYEYTVEQACLTLPIEFHGVYTGKDNQGTWHMIIKPNDPLPVPVAQSKIPQHVLKGFVEGLIAAKETCPVTMEELSLGNIAITSCYHAFERSTIQHIMGTSRRCPTCRAELTDNITMM